MFGPGICWSGLTLNRCGCSNGAGETQARRKPSKECGKPSKGNRKRGKGIRKGIKGKPFRELGLFNGLRRSGAKTRFSPLLPAPLLEAARSATGPLYPWFLIIARKSRALMALCVGRPVCCSFVEPLPSWPGLSRPSTPGRRKNESRLGATGRKADGRKAFRACLRRCAGPSWMAGTSPAMTP